MNETTTWKVEVHETKNATIAEREIFLLACKELELEINHDGFWVECARLYESWECKKWFKDDRRYQTFEEFKKEYLSGADNFNKAEDGDLDVHVIFYYSFKNVVGYTYPSTWFTWVNRKLFKGFNVGDIAGYVAHEGLHNMGLDHPGTNRQSVVYQFGYLVRRRIKARINNKEVVKPIVKKYVPLWKRVLLFWKY